MQYGYEMGKKYKDGKENLKKNIRFEDSEHTFVIDIKLPGAADDDWMTVSYEHALADRRENATNWEANQGEKLSSRRTGDRDGEDGRGGKGGQGGAGGGGGGFGGLGGNDDEIRETHH